mmetsp:Transcript_9270/g.23484  ORF Transcript_9270/g.23484 Transcript_9270/m.23484 type:complete len:219 (+) Transcript_9270:519-1175(+)
MRAPRHTTPRSMPRTCSRPLHTTACRPLSSRSTSMRSSGWTRRTSRAFPIISRFTRRQTGPTPRWGTLRATRLPNQALSLHLAGILITTWVEIRWCQTRCMSDTTRHSTAITSKSQTSTSQTRTASQTRSLSRSVRHSWQPRRVGNTPAACTCTPQWPSRIPGVPGCAIRASRATAIAGPWTRRSVPVLTAATEPGPTSPPQTTSKIAFSSSSPCKMT